LALTAIHPESANLLACCLLENAPALLGAFIVTRASNLSRLIVFATCCKDLRPFLSYEEVKDAAPVQTDRKRRHKVSRLGISGTLESCVDWRSDGNRQPEQHLDGSLCGSRVAGDKPSPRRMCCRGFAGSAESRPGELSQGTTKGAEWRPLFAETDCAGEKELFG